MSRDYADPIPPLKVQIAAAIVRATADWSQVNAAALLEIDQPRMSDLRNERLERFSLEQLLRLLIRADGLIDVRLSSSRRRALFRTIGP